MSKHVSRRQFLKSGAFAGVTILVGPGLARTYAANEKLGLAHIATAGRGGSHLGLSKNEHCIALVEPDRERVQEAAKRYPNAKVFEDYRTMFDAVHQDLDAVVIATPDHHHAPAAMRALKLGKHVYCEKPLTYSIEEARLLAEETARQKVATQKGNQGDANEGNRLVVEWVRAGAIGTVQEVHTWTNRPVWPQGIAQRPPSTDAPASLNWDVWIGPAPMRDYHDGLHPFKWRGWIDFGCGAVGDMGCHTWDCVWWSMDPDAPLSAECLKAEAKNDETFPSKAMYKWEFGPKGDRPGFVAYWYEGGWKPDCPEELATDEARQPKQRQLPNSGSLFIGDKGKLLVSGDYGNSPRLIPEAAMREFAQNAPEKTIPRSPGHHQEWVMACKGEKPWDFPKSNFLYGGPLVEAMNLGNVALLVGEKLTWDAKNLRAVNCPKADRYIRRTYRKGWEL